MLSDVNIVQELEFGSLKIEPYDIKTTQPASVDLTLSRYIRTNRYNRVKENLLINPLDPDTFGMDDPIEVTSGGYVIQPSEFILGSTVEKVWLPSHISGKVEGKSSIGRLGLMVHVTAGFIDPGFVGQITLEMVNVNNTPIVLYPGMSIAQMSFSYLNTPSVRPYGSEGLNSKYQNQEGPTVSMYHKNA